MKRIKVFTQDQINSMCLSQYTRRLSEPADLDMGKLWIEVSKLPHRHEPAVLVMRFILGFTLRDVADVLGISVERVRQVEHKAIRMLRHPKRLERYYCKED